MKIAVAALAVLTMSHCGARGDESRCAQLVQLNSQYRDVALTAEEQRLKAKMVIWYRINCRTKRRN